MVVLPNGFGDVTPAAFRVGCDLQHHSTADAAVGAHGAHGVVGGPHGDFRPLLSGTGICPKSSVSDVSVRRIRGFSGFTDFSQWGMALCAQSDIIAKIGW
jgi:hypothetical protein